MTARVRIVAAARRLAFAEPPGAAAAVMAGGVLSLCFGMTGPQWLSDALLAVTATVWVVLITAFAACPVFDPARWTREADLPPALTLVAGTAVLGSRTLTLGQEALAQGLLIIATLLWIVLLPGVLRHWQTPATGSSFLVCVSTQSLAVLAAQLARRTGDRWLAFPAAAAFVLGLALYALVLVRFDLRHLVRGRGDQWVVGGALAISALAGAALLNGVSAGGSIWSAAQPALRTITQVLWWAAVAAYFPLAASEAGWPRLHYDISRWSTAFPLGMLALTGLSLSPVIRSQPLHDAASALSWLAMAVWLTVAAAALRRARPTARRRRRSGSCRRHHLFPRVVPVVYPRYGRDGVDVRQGMLAGASADAAEDLPMARVPGELTARHGRQTD
ncbi:tellurite resistance/C4-dicarboxylate transporter family protein [Streptomyces sp. RB6PN25]|uniref:Tellurite resistance/C4-dicarboxylate transporter family protein n=1 Tax=Streptomyces humicola TaxID=2953240 RepID=A0ABT1PN81_9ACTN|nr:tellurite resistance/C4-dicarboxylate transporter family protein [Streptomyces humicola]MCQ4079141.1 tellurite resistance/C4-dicarboxylate transporter family protein [Streptomyces humicola]